MHPSICSSNNNYTVKINVLRYKIKQCFNKSKLKFPDLQLNQIIVRMMNNAISYWQFFGIFPVILGMLTIKCFFIRVCGMSVSHFTLHFLQACQIFTDIQLWFPVLLFFESCRIILCWMMPYNLLHGSSPQKSDSHSSSSKFWAFKLPTTKIIPSLFLKCWNVESMTAIWS